MTNKRGLTYVFAALGVAALTLAGVSEGCALLPLGIIAVSFIGCVLFTALGLILHRYLGVVGRWFGWLFVFALASLLPTSIVTAFQQRATGHVATSVAAAIETYRVAHGDYPASLDQLVPEHFSSPPKTRFGISDTNFSYTSNTNSFRLGYSLPFGLFRQYDSKTRTWETRD
jgi:hypothetical protein